MVAIRPRPRLDPPDRHADVPGEIVAVESAEDNAAARSSERRIDLVHHKSDAKQGRQVARAEDLGNEAADEWREAEDRQHSHCAGEHILSLQFFV